MHIGIIINSYLFEGRFFANNSQSSKVERNLIIISLRAVYIGGEYEA